MMGENTLPWLRSEHADKRLRVESLSASYGKRQVVSGVSFECEPGSCTVLIGPNGSGKSTLLRSMARLSAPDAGCVIVSGQDLSGLSRRQLARTIAVLSQGSAAPEGLTVRQLVEQGRFPHHGPWRMLAAQRDPSIAQAIHRCELDDLANRLVEELSGGECQRAWLALAVAQQAPVLFLDEPTTYLDLGHQLEMLELVAALRQEQQLTVVMVLHDVNQAIACADQLVVLQGGSVVASGPPAEVITVALLREVFRVEADIVHDAVSGRPLVIARRACRSPASSVEAVSSKIG